MSIAAAGAFALGEFPESAMVMLLYQAGEFLQDKAADKARRSIKGLADVRPDRASKLTESGYISVSADEVHVGDTIRITAGERVPLDCRITDGGGFVDTSALTGESTPRRVSEGDNLSGGYISTDGLITAEVTAEFADSAAARIQRLVEECGDRKSRSERFITRFAKVYTPVVCLLALLIALVPILFFNAEASVWIYRALIFLVVSCPCALIISVPLTFYAGLGGCARKHILIKGAAYLEQLAKLKTVVFDKTGTLTTGTFEVESVSGDDNTLEYAAFAECHSNHPIGKSIKNAYGREIDESRISEFEERSGKGVCITLEGRRIRVGNAALMQEAGISVPDTERGKTTVFVAADNRLCGYIVIADKIKPDSAASVSALKNAGIKTVMLTGDVSSAANAAAEKLGIDEVHSQLLPQDKVTRLSSLLNSKTVTAFVGDGINDAPSLALADIGIAMGEKGADSAVQAADIIIMNDNISEITTGIKSAKHTMTVVYENIIFSIGIKMLVMLLGAAGLAGMWLAMFADVGVALLAVLNSLRAAK